MQNSFEEEYVDTLGIDLQVKNVEMDGLNLKLNIWDIAGETIFENNIDMKYFE